MELQFTEQTEAGEMIEVTIKGEAENQAELKLLAIQSLISGMDLKHDFDGDYEKFHRAVEQLLLSVTDIIGYEHYYWENTPNEEKSYNEFDELVVSKKAKIALLEQIVKNMKDNL